MLVIGEPQLFCLHLHCLPCDWHQLFTGGWRGTGGTGGWRGTGGSGGWRGYRWSRWLEGVQVVGRGTGGAGGWRGYRWSRRLQTKVAARFILIKENPQNKSIKHYTCVRALAGCLPFIVQHVLMSAYGNMMFHLVTDGL